MNKDRLKEIKKKTKFIYDVINKPDGYKLVNKDNVQHLQVRYTSLDGSGKWYFKWFVSYEVRNKIVHNYE